MANIRKNMILIVADTSNTQDLLTDYLKGFGFNLLLANDGETAMDVAKHAQPDIILLDTNLPGGSDGFETCQQLKATPATQDIPVIFMTSLTNTVDKVRAFVLGAVDYITKPIQSEEVVARVKTHLTLQKLQKSLAEQNARLQVEIDEREQLIAELDAFAHTVAHDLKNPLGVTINHAQFIRKYRDRIKEEDIENHLDTVIKNGYKMANIIDELLMLSSVRREEITPSPLDMAEILAEAKTRLAYLILEHQAELVIDDPSKWPVAWGYSPWIEEVWVNYIGNAIKYGGQPPRIEVGAAAQRNGTVKFWVKDNGDGLDPAEQARLFIPFTRLNQAHTEGHGLGLSIVQRIIRKLGGTVKVESDHVPGHGATFSFSLPSQPAEQELPEPTSTFF